TFHLRHGEQWMTRICQSEEGKARIQAAVDWMFPLTVEWFGLPDDLKHNTGQLTYGLKGSSNDTLRQRWLATAVPFCEKVGIRVPELPLSVVDMGLIYGAWLEGRTAYVKLTYTSMGCPCADFIVDDIRERLLHEAGVERVDVEIVWDPPWSKRMLSEDARDTLS